MSLRTVLRWMATVLGAVVLAAALLLVSGYVAVVAWDLTHPPKLDRTIPPPRPIPRERSISNEDASMERLHKEFEIRAPLHAAYDHWTRFEQFPRFMEGVKEVRRLDDTHLHWRASIAGREKQWEAEITEQVPDRVIAWRSISGAPNSGRVTFEPVGTDRTCVRLDLEYVPQTAVERAGDALGIVSRKIDKAVEDFTEYIEREPRLHGVAPTPRVGSGLAGAAAAGNPAARGVAPGGAGGALPGSTGGTPGPGGGKPGTTARP